MTLHIELSILDHFIDSNKNIFLINIICGMIQFVAVIPITDKSSEKLAGLFYDIYVIRSILFLDII